MISIMRPLLPTVADLAPYLDRIDHNRWYSNNGELVREFEEELSSIFNCYVCTASSGTSALICSLMASLPFNPKSRAMIGMPSWTYAATASAVFSAGFRPIFLDVDNSGVVTTDSAGGCQAFVVVAPLGAPLDLEYWDWFAEEYSNPVIIDAAAGFDSFSKIKIGNNPVIISTHCTKVFGTGEGGFVLSKDKELIDRIRKITNHGMDPDKKVTELGINAKMSEYHAAIGLAELKNWEWKREKWLEIQSWYGDERDYAVSTHDQLLEVPAFDVVQKLNTDGIQARTSWYGTCHLQDCYTKVWFNGMGGDGKIHTKMTNTDFLRQHTIFLPKYIGMTKEEVFHIRERLHVHTR